MFYADGVYDVDTLLKLIMENLLAEIKDTSWGKDIFNQFIDYIGSLNLFAFTVKFKKESKPLIANIRSNFAHFLVELTKKMKNKNAIFIIIDDINGLLDTPDFAN